MSAISYCEEAFAILRANIASELAGVQYHVTQLLSALQDETAHRADALAHARAANAALAEMAVGYEPTHAQKVSSGTSDTPTPKPSMPEPVEVAAPKTVSIKPAKVEKKK